VNAQEENFNIWEIKTFLPTSETDKHKNGDIFMWDATARQKKSINHKFQTINNAISDGAQFKVYSKLMCNYFSIGVESRVGLGFDK
jgi:Diacylglycerol kinase accessory domain